MPSPSVSSKYQRVARSASSLARHALGAGGVVDLVVHVGDVLDELRLVALLAQPVPHPEENDVRSRVPDVDPLVDRRPADVHANRARRRGQLLLAAGERVVDLHRP